MEPTQGVLWRVEQSTALVKMHLIRDLVLKICKSLKSSCLISEYFWAKLPASSHPMRVNFARPSGRDKSVNMQKWYTNAVLICRVSIVIHFQILHAHSCLFDLLIFVSCSVVDNQNVSDMRMSGSIKQNKPRCEMYYRMPLLKMNLTNSQ